MPNSYSISTLDRKKKELDRLGKATGSLRKKNKKMTEKNKYSLVMVGAAGSGKSSLVNSFRGLRPDHSKASPVGEVETTTVPTPYAHPDYPHIVFWDLPGGGTRNHPAGDYFEEKCCYAYDCLIVVTNARFTQLDLDIAHLAKQWNVPVFFVRSKSDVDIDSKIFNNNLSPEDAKTALIREATDNIRTQLNTIGMADRSIYVVSSRAFLFPQRFSPIDENRLVQDITTIALQRRRG